MVKTLEKVKCEIDKELFVQYEELAITIVHCTYSPPQKFMHPSWVNIYPATYLVNQLNGEKIQMIHTIDIPLPPRKIYLKSFRDKISFTLIFPEIPKDWAVFDLIESTCIGYNLISTDIIRNDSGIYRIYTWLNV